MQKLCEEFPWLYQEFQDGFHAVRRSNRHWSGLWSDLTIEQTLMRSIKTRGGLTRGRGMSESVRHMWTLTLHTCASVHDSMMDLTGLMIKSCEQHVDVIEARRCKDTHDYEKIKNWWKNEILSFTAMKTYIHLHSMEDVIFFLIVFEYNSKFNNFNRIRAANATQKKFVLFHEVGEQIKILFLLPLLQ